MTRTWSVLMAGAVLVASGAQAGVFVVRGTNGETKLVNLPGIERGRAVPQGSASKRQQLWPAVEELAQTHGVDPGLIDLMIRMESGYNSHAVSPKGARGLMQLMPATARLYGVEDVYNSYQNLGAGIRYFADLLQRFDNDLALALAAYNAGPEAVVRHRGVPPYRETRDYVSSILSAYQGVGGPLLSGGFGRPATRRPLELRSTEDGLTLTNSRRVGEASVERRLTLR